MLFLFAVLTRCAKWSLLFSIFICGISLQLGRWSSYLSTMSFKRLNCENDNDNHYQLQPLFNLSPILESSGAFNCFVFAGYCLVLIAIG